MLQCLENLADEDMQMIEMRYFEKRSFKEIGEILDITENNAKVKTYRILDKMKNLMQLAK
jgi:RNA polymerase sigma-70 factor, ECF subfamily